MPSTRAFLLFLTMQQLFFHHISATHNNKLKHNDRATSYGVNRRIGNGRMGKATLIYLTSLIKSSNDDNEQPMDNISAIILAINMATIIESRNINKQTIYDASTIILVVNVATN